MTEQPGVRLSPPRPSLVGTSPEEAAARPSNSILGRDIPSAVSRYPNIRWFHFNTETLIKHAQGHVND
jgi:hypothetical protein